MRNSKTLPALREWILFGILGALTFGIGTLWVIPYKNAAYAAFYRQIADYPKYTIE